jgi:DNA-directed RNA polymerase specialized sigma24 family protein
MDGSLNVGLVIMAAPQQSFGAQAGPGISRADGADTKQQALSADSVGLALLVMLDILAPAGRLAFVLHDIFDFDVPFGEIATMVGRSETAARQLVSRMRRRIQQLGPGTGRQPCRLPVVFS